MTYPHEIARSQIILHDILKLNLGCGSCIPAGWVNVDYAVGARFARLPFFYLVNSKLKLFSLNWDRNILLHDLRKRFPWNEYSVDIIYSSHTLEHLSKNDGIHFLKECYRVLKQNGIVRIVVPDLNAIVRSYVNNDISADAFLDELGVAYEKPYESLIKRKLAPFISNPHKCMYDYKTLLRTEVSPFLRRLFVGPRVLL